MRFINGIIVSLLVILTVFSGNSAKSQTGVLSPNDPIVVYDPAHPPTTPPNGTLAKWVKTNRVGFNTSSFKSYFYKGLAFRLKFPKSYQDGVVDGKTYPLYLFFHGIGEAGTIYDNEYQLYHGGEVHMNAVDNGTFDGFLMYPQTPSGNGFFGTGQYDVIAELINNYLIPQVKVDPYRILVDGLSGGGTATWGFSMRYPKLIAALLPISAASTVFNDGIPDLKYTPIWQHQGGLDQGPTPATTSVIVNAYKNAGANFTYTIYPTLGHGCWDSAWAEPDYYPYLLRAYKSNPWTLFGRTEFCPTDAINVTIGMTPGFTAYQWRKDGNLISGASGNSIVVNAIGTYDCRYQNGTVWSPWSPTPVVIKIKAATVSPAITVAGLMSKVIPALDGNTSVKLQVPTGYATYTWQKVGSTTTLSTTNGLTAATAGDYIVKVTEQFGCSSDFSTPFTVVDANGPNKPDPASNLTVATDSKTSVRLNWTANPTPAFPQTNFEIYQANTASGPFILAAIASRDSLSWLINGLNPNSTYYFKIRSVNNTGSASASNTASGITGADIDAPTAPGNLSISSSTRTSVSLSWNPSTDNVGVTEYDVYVNGIKSYVTTATQFTVYNLTYGNFYNFTVKAKDFANNSSPFSNQATTQTLSKGLNYKYYTFTGTWNSLPDFNALTPVKTGIVPNVTIDNRTQDDNFGYLWEGTIRIPVGGSYTFRTNSDDGSKLYLGALNQTASPYAFAATALVNNDGLHGTQDRDATITLAAGTYPIAITYYEQGGGQSINLYWNSPQTAGNFVTIPDSVFADQATSNLQIPLAPSNLIATTQSFKRIDLSWTDNSSNETGFEIWRSTDSVSNFAVVGSRGPNITSYSDSSLAANTTYFYRVRAIGKFGESDFDRAGSGVAYGYYETTGLSVLPDFSSMIPVRTGRVPTFGLLAGDREDDFELKFNGQISIQTAGTYTFYTSSDDGSKLYIDGFDEAHKVVDNDGLHGTQERSGTITLAAGLHAIYVTFFERGGGQVLETRYQGPGIPKQLIPAAVLGDPLVRATTTALPGTALPPTALLASGTAKSVIQINWTDNSNNETGFELYRSATTNGNYSLRAALAANTVSYSDTGLFANAIYYYKVRAMNIGGGSAYSNEDSAITINSIPTVNPIADQYMHFGTTLTVNVKAADADLENLDFVLTGLPSFASFLATGNGTGVISFNNPDASLQNTYPGITITVNDQHGGSASTTFTLIVNDNYKPLLSGVVNTTVAEKQTAQINLSATDQNAGDVLTWSFTGLPAFATVTTGTGTAQVSLAPGYADNGTYRVTAKVDDGNHGFDTASFVITVTDVNPNTTVYVNFTDGSLIAASPWNNTSKIPALNDVFANLKDSSGNNTGISIKMNTLWTGVNNAGSNTTNNSGIYPDNVLRTSYYSSTVQNLTISGLDVNRSYNFTFLGSRANPAAGVNVVGTYTIGAQAVSLNAANNTSSTVTIPNVIPAVGGTVTLTVQKATGSTYAYLNSMVIQSLLNDGTAPAKPRNLTANLLNGKMRLNWVDASYNETAYEIYKANSFTGPYTLLNPGGNNPNLQQYDDSTISGNKNYFYAVRAVNSVGGTYSDTVSITTPNASPVIAAIADVKIKTTQTLDLSISATDDPGDLITLSASGLPAFASFTDNGAGSGTIHITPGNTIGSFGPVVIIATDDKGASSSKSFNITSTDINVSSVYVNFNQLFPASAPWNNTNSAPNAGVVISNLKDADNNNSGIALTLVDKWTASNTLGVSTGNNSGIYPDTVMQTFYYENSATAKHIQLSGLSASRKYNLVLFASRGNYVGSLITNYTVGTTTVSLDAANNSSNTVQINGISPDVNGQIQLTIAKAASSSNAYLGALVIQSYPYDGTPLAPKNLSAAGIAKDKIQLNWTSAADNTTGYEVWKSTSSGGTFSKIADVAASNTSYTDAGLSGGSIFYYQVRAVVNSAFSAFTNVASASTVAFTININLNDGSTGAPAQGSPWNNTNTLIDVGFVLPNLVNDQAQNTGINFGVIRGFSGFNTVGASTGNNSGIYPDNVMKSLYYLNYGDSAILKISGLNQTYLYNFSFFGSRANPVVGVTSIYRIGNQTAQLDATNNTTNTIQLNAIKPDATGAVYISVSAAISGGFGYLNELSIQGVPNTDSAALLAANAALNAARNARALEEDGLDQNATIQSVMAFPNPFQDDVTLRLALKENVDKFTVLVNDMNGKTIFRKEFFNAQAGIWQQQIGLNARALNKGVYIVSVAGIANEKPKIFKVIKQ